jgi:hypothetical protein
VHRVGFLGAGDGVDGGQRHGIKIHHLAQRHARGAVHLSDDLPEDIPDIMRRAIVRC